MIRFLIIIAALAGLYYKIDRLNTLPICDHALAAVDTINKQREEHHGKTR